MRYPIRLSLLWLVGLSASTSSFPDCKFPSLLDATQSDIQNGLRLGCFTSVDLVQAYITRIHEVNSKLNPVLEINPEAISIAEQLDQARQQGKTFGPLHGLPVLVKDLIGTHDRMETSAGSYALIGAKVSADATVVANLRKAGAIILGKTSLSEWANTRSLNSTHGWNAIGGQTYAAYYEQQDPSGSSSGSAVATDLGLAFAALGTETSGSIILPAEKSNVVGIKPTVGLTSRYMVIPVSEHADTIGPLARTVRDAAIILQAIAGKDVNDNYTMSSPFQTSQPDYVAACSLVGLQGMRIGIPRNVISTLPRFFGSAAGPIISSFEKAIASIREAGATIVEDANFTAYGTFMQSQSPAKVVAADLLSGLASYLSGLTSNPNNLQGLADVRKFTQLSHEEGYPSRDTRRWDSAIYAGMNNSSPDFWPLYQQTLSLGEEGGLLGALSRHGLDAAILPSCLATDVPGVIGTPIVTVPFDAFPRNTPVQYNSRGDVVDVAPGIPLGVSFLGPKWSEQSLISMAYAFEQRTLSRKKLHRVVEPLTELEDLVFANPENNEYSMSSCAPRQ
ncbi:putative amidase [Aspergillus undulatus]|uniref:putative amidase n=1 Tax=Aspergillus undulatus TaxID=1810928 RepID=UPI003CCD1CC3